MNTWMPQVDGTMGNLQKAVDDVGSRVAVLEANRTTAETETPHTGLPEPGVRLASLNSTLGRAHIEAAVPDSDVFDVGCCNQLGRVQRGRPMLYPLGFPGKHYIMSCTTVRRNTPNQSKFCQTRALHRHHSLLHPERQHAPAFGRAGLRNQSPL